MRLRKLPVVLVTSACLGLALGVSGLIQTNNASKERSDLLSKVRLKADTNRDGDLDKNERRAIYEAVGRGNTVFKEYKLFNLTTRDLRRYVNSEKD